MGWPSVHRHLSGLVRYFSVSRKEHDAQFDRLAREQEKARAEIRKNEIARRDLNASFDALAAAIRGDREK